MTSRRSFVRRRSAAIQFVGLAAACVGVLLVAAPAGASGDAAAVGVEYSSTGAHQLHPVAGVDAPAADPARKVKVNTFADWDGSTVLFPFGNLDTATYGQTFTSASKPSELKKFVFSLSANSGTGPIVFQGFVYQWDSDHQRATGPLLWQSDVRSKAFHPGHYRELEFITAGTEPKLVPNTEYVVFLSVSTTYEETTPNVLAQWALTPQPDAYEGGAAVWLNNGGDEAQWTTATWSSAGTQDFVTKINTETTS